MNILVVDDHELMRNGLINIVEEEFSSAVIKEASNGMEAEKFARSQKWSLVVMDMTMSDKTGLDVLKQMRAEENRSPVLILSIHPENQYAVRVLKAGGNGYLSKDCPRQELVIAMRTIMNGKKYISQSLAQSLASQLEDCDKEQHELISDRELQVLKLIASGKKVSEIALELSLSVPTISTYRNRLLEKMQMKNNAELALYAINKKLL